MIVCHCEVVRSRTIERAIRRGATSIEALGDQCRAGTRCGGCHEALCEMLDAAHPAVASYESVVQVAIAV